MGPDDLRIESGRVRWTGARVSVDEPELRAVVTSGDGNAAELVFSYQGPSATERPFASGELRRQIGLKLRAQDTCNVVYVMWHIEPSAGIAVSTKSNAGESTHPQCADRGYIHTRSDPGTVTPQAPAPGHAHSLKALLDGRRLRVFTDGALAWQGTLPEAASILRGPAGVRADNGRFDFELRLPTDEAEESTDR